MANVAVPLTATDFEPMPFSQQVTTMEPAPGFAQATGFETLPGSEPTTGFETLPGTEPLTGFETAPGFEQATGFETVTQPTASLATSPRNTLIGDDNPNSLVGSAIIDLIEGRGGGDLLFAPAGTATLDGGDGNDTLTARTGNHSMLGGAGDDFITLGSGTHVVDGGDGNDTVSASFLVSPVILSLVQGSALHGGVTDRIANVENAVGGTRTDTITGDLNPNRLEGGPGADVITGRDGADTFVFSAPYEGRDDIMDFTRDSDTIGISRAGFNLDALGPGTLPSSQLAVGSSASGSERFVYDPSSGDLSFDPDGSGPADAVELAHLAVAEFSARDIVLF